MILENLKRWLITKMHGISTEKGAFANRFSVFEKPAALQGNVIVQNCKIGRYSYVGHNSWVGNADIGRFCSIGPKVLIGPGKHPADKISTSPIFYSPHKQCGESWVERSLYQENERISIGSDVWIGAHTIILDGCKIGHGAIIAAGSIVNKDVPPYAIFAGVPAKLIRYRFDEKIINDLLAFEWWNKDVAWIKKNYKLFNSLESISILMQST